MVTVTHLTTWCQNDREALYFYRIVTGEDWNRVLHDSMLSPPYCSRTPHSAFWTTDCGSFVAAIVYYCRFIELLTT